MRRISPPGIPGRLPVGGHAQGLTQIPFEPPPLQASRLRKLGILGAVIAAHAAAFGLPHLLTSTPSPELTTLETALSHIQVVDSRPQTPGYSREEFGHGWAKSAFSNTVCTTREIVLNTQLQVNRRKGCSIIEGSGTDPYTLAPLIIGHIDIDHIFPLSAAWDLGAAHWTPEQRLAFANDRQRNLVAVDSAVNRRKSDGTPEEWMPPHKSQQCWYALRYAQVAEHYSLAITTGDARTLRRACTPNKWWRPW